MQIPVEKPKIIEDGKHVGVIIDVCYRDKPFKYTDLVIEFDNGIQAKAGYPTKLMEESKLGLLLKRFGIVVAEGLTADPDILKGRKCEFVTIQEKTDKGIFAKIVADSVKPANPADEIQIEAINELAKQK